MSEPQSSAAVNPTTADTTSASTTPPSASAQESTLTPTAPAPQGLAGALSGHFPLDPPPDSAPWHELVRYWAWKYVGTLVMDRNPDGEYVMSLGRVATAALLAQAMYRWGITGIDIPDSMRETLWILLGYNFGSKGISVAHTWIKSVQSKTSESQANA